MSRSTAKVRIAPTAIKKMLAPIPIVCVLPEPEPRGCAISQRWEIPALAAIERVGAIDDGIRRCDNAASTE
jgi:hypothetical protein